MRYGFPAVSRTDPAEPVKPVKIADILAPGYEQGGNAFRLHTRFRFAMRFFSGLSFIRSTILQVIAAALRARR